MGWLMGLAIADFLYFYFRTRKWYPQLLLWRQPYVQKSGKKAKSKETKEICPSLRALQLATAPHGDSTGTTPTVKAIPNVADDTGASARTANTSLCNTC